MDNKTIYREISIDDIEEPEDQIRTVIVLEGLQELAASIKEKGIIEPLIVLKKNNKYEIVAGHRRYLAAKMIGLVALPCIIRAVNIIDKDLFKLHENFGREDVNPVDEARFFIKIHEKHALAFSEIARLCSRSETYVSNRIQLLQCDPRVLEALEGRQINFSQALEIARASDEHVREELLRVTVESGATVESLHVMRQDYERRISNGDPALVGSAPEPGHYPEVKHLIICPACKGSYPINEIYPISMCKTCYDGFLAGLKEN